MNNLYRLLPAIALIITIGCSTSLPQKQTDVIDAPVLEVDDSTPTVTNCEVDDATSSDTYREAEETQSSLMYAYEAETDILDQVWCGLPKGACIQPDRESPADQTGRPDSDSQVNAPGREGVWNKHSPLNLLPILLQELAAIITGHVE